MHTKDRLFHPALRLFCLMMIIIIAFLSQPGPQSENIRSANATVTSVEYKQENKTKGPLTEYQYLSGTYEVDGEKYNVDQRNEMPLPEYKVNDTFIVHYDYRHPDRPLDSAHLPKGLGGSALSGGEFIGLIFTLPFILTLVGSFVYLYHENKRPVARRVK